MRFTRVQLSVQRLLFTSLLVLIWSVPLQAQVLTSAEIHKMIRQVQLRRSIGGIFTTARGNEILTPGNQLRTLARSRAELKFNEGSLARVSQKTIFHFYREMRRNHIRNQKGVILAMVPPGGDIAQVETPQGTAFIFPPEISQQPNKLPSDKTAGLKSSDLASITDYRNKSAKFVSDSNYTEKVELIQSQISPLSQSQPDNLSSDLNANFAGSALVAVADDIKKESRFFNLTPHSIIINNPQGTQTVILQGGQTVTASNGVLGKVQNFNLKKFYKTTKIAIGLGPGQEDLIAKEPKSVQKTIRAIRKQTLLAIKAQERWVNGLCTLNSRGSASTLSTNCISTGNDPVDKFEDIRDRLPPEDNQDEINQGNANPAGGNPAGGNPVGTPLLVGPNTP